MRIVCDDDVNARDWNDVILGDITSYGPGKGILFLVENTPIDYLDFASPVSGLGSKMGLDATNKWPGETQREWGRPSKDPDVVAHIDAIWDELAILTTVKAPDARVCFALFIDPTEKAHDNLKL